MLIRQITPQVNFLSENAHKSSSIRNPCKTKVTRGVTEYLAFICIDFVNCLCETRGHLVDARKLIVWHPVKIYLHNLGNCKTTQM